MGSDREATRSINQRLSSREQYTIINQLSTIFSNASDDDDDDAFHFCFRSMDGSSLARA